MYDSAQPFRLPLGSLVECGGERSEIREMPGELRSEGRVVVCLNPMDREGEMLPDFP